MVSRGFEDSNLWKDGDGSNSPDMGFEMCLSRILGKLDRILEFGILVLSLGIGMVTNMIWYFWLGMMVGRFWNKLKRVQMGYVGVLETG